MKMTITTKKVEKFKEIAKDFAKEALLKGYETEEEIENVTFFVASTMAVGARFKRNEHILTGVAIGVGLSALTLKATIINEERKMRNETKKEETLEED